MNAFISERQASLPPSGGKEDPVVAGGAGGGKAVGPAGAAGGPSVEAVGPLGSSFVALELSSAAVASSGAAAGAAAAGLDDLDSARGAGGACTAVPSDVLLSLDAATTGATGTNAGRLSTASSLSTVSTAGASEPTLVLHADVRAQAAAAAAAAAAGTEGVAQAEPGHRFSDTYDAAPVPTNAPIMDRVETAEAGTQWDPSEVPTEEAAGGEGATSTPLSPSRPPPNMKRVGGGYVPPCR